MAGAAEDLYTETDIIEEPKSFEGLVQLGPNVTKAIRNRFSILGDVSGADLLRAANSNRAKFLAAARGVTSLKVSGGFVLARPENRTIGSEPIAAAPCYGVPQVEPSDAHEIVNDATLVKEEDEYPLDVADLGFDIQTCEPGDVLLVCDQAEKVVACMIYLGLDPEKDGSVIVYTRSQTGANVPASFPKEIINQLSIIPCPHGPVDNVNDTRELDEVVNEYMGEQIQIDVEND